MKKGQTILPMKVSVSAPPDAELRSYSGSIFALLKPLNDGAVGGGQVSIGLGANIVVEVTVTGEERSDYEVKSVKLSDQKKDAPLTVAVTVQNTGNTALAEIDGMIEIYERIVMRSSKP